MSHREFTSAKAESEKEPITFSIDGETYHCVPKLSWQMIETMARAASGGADASSVIELGKFFRQVVLDEDLERFEQVLSRKTNAVDADLLGEVVMYLVEEYTGRPTLPPSGSRNGRNATGLSLKENSSSPEPFPQTSP